MNIKLKDYKNEFSKIELEIFLKENTFSKFIYYMQNSQIYFNNNQE